MFVSSLHMHATKEQFYWSQNEEKMQEDQDDDLVNPQLLKPFRLSSTVNPSEACSGICTVCKVAHKLRRSVAQ